MLGLYVHIPFCARRCPYCDFAIVPAARTDLIEEYVSTLRSELASTLLAARSGACAGRELTSIFFGGGTPTRLDGNTLAALLQHIHELFPVATDAEITLEANPEDATHEKFTTLRDAGYNRISFGAQSFDASELRLLGRRHNATQIAEAVQVARTAGFDNIGLDCIYALPGQTLAQWHDTLSQVVDLGVPHVSCYSLTIEDGTSFGKRVAQGVLHPLDDEIQSSMMQTAAALLRNAGLTRYETSNYAKDGYRSTHNENYWRGGDYLACGNAAHGHLNGRRWWNEREPRAYISAYKERGSAIAGEEILTPRQRFDELVLLGLRMNEGFHLADIAKKLKVEIPHTMSRALEELEASGVLTVNCGWVKLDETAMPIADGVATRLLS